MEERGLTTADVQERTAAGKVNSYESRTSRSYANIIFGNLFTSFNVILFILGAALVFFKEYISAASATGVILINVLVATVQEIKAKRRLDKIALLMRPKVTVRRNGQIQEIDRAKLVIDDLVHLTAGDQAQVDGTVLEEHGLEMDESLLTGESGTRRRHAGDEIYSGAVCVAGNCWFRVTMVGQDTFSSQMLSSAKKFEKKRTPLQTETNSVTQLLMGIAFLYLLLMVILNLIHGRGLVVSLNMAVVILDIVPIALFLLITITYMIAAVRMANTGVLLQNSSAVESMSHVNTVCMDKTGTITTNHLVFDSIDYLTADQAGTDRLIKCFAGSTSSRNRTIQALVGHFGEEKCALQDEIQFSSDRKYSAVKLPDGKTVVMGAWPFLKEQVSNPAGIADRLKALSAKGLRSVVICTGDSAPLHQGDEPVLPPLTALAVIAIGDEVRPDCKEILGQFAANGMDVKVISGDDPETVDAIFTLAEIPGARKTISGEELADLHGVDYQQTVLETNIFGRMKPEQKEEVITTLRGAGRYVAMVGDGVNDVRSIKRAQVGVALQTGSGAARGVADMVLVNDDFKALPQAIREGKRTVSGMRDILKLYLVRNFTLSLLVFFLLICLNRMPMMPIQNTYYALETVSFAAFLLAIWAQPSENSDLVLPGVMRYVLPMSALISVFALALYAAFYLSTEYGLIDLTAVYQSMADTMHWSLAETMDHLGMDDLTEPAEINARNAMLMFLVMSGISQLFLLFPLSRHWSPSGRTTKDVKPTLLAFLLYGVMMLLYSVPAVAVGIVGLVIFPADYVVLFIAVTAIWFLCALYILRRPIMGHVADWFDHWIRHKLKEDLAKESAGDNAEKESADQDR